jgi:hypothetical protein
MRAGQASRTAEFLKAQLADVKAELAQHERRAAQFKLNHMGELPQQVEANLGSLERLNSQLPLMPRRHLPTLEHGWCSRWRTWTRSLRP